MKTHKTVTVTARMLKKFGACDEGIETVSEFLPAKLSTDPEKNIELACHMVDSAAALTRNFDGGHWLVHRATTESDVFPDGELLVGDYFDTQRDAWITAQYLAWVADGIATRAGR